MTYPPIIIGGTGGSGTRVTTELLQNANVYMGSEANLNEPIDAQAYEPLLDKYISAILEHTRSLNYSRDDVPAPLWDEAISAFYAAEERHCHQAEPAAHWGFKNPRSMFVLPLLHQLYPQMAFIHMLRDGRDMAFSHNQNQVHKHYSALFGESPDALSLPEASIKLWAKANSDVRAWGEEILGAHYYSLRFEDLCASPDIEQKELYNWLGLKQQEATVIAAPDSIGRWKQQDGLVIKKLNVIGADALDMFGY